MNELKDKPGWLETLWNENPGLAERAEETLRELQNKTNEETEYDYYNSEKRKKQQEDSMKIFAWSIAGMILTITTMLIWTLII